MKLDVVHLQYRIDECNSIIERCKEKLAKNLTSIELVEILELLEQRRRELEQQLNRAGGVYSSNFESDKQNLI